jgi:hypothetical protein
MLSALLTAAVAADDPAPTGTSGILDGRGWNLLSKQSKGFAIKLIQDSAIFFDHEKKGVVGPIRSSSHFFPTSVKFTIDELAVVIDRIYSKPFNLVIPLLAVLPVGIALFEGARRSD